MQIISKEKIVPYVSEDMYRLVAAIEKYPDFVPYCVGSAIILEQNNTVEASIDVAFISIKKTFITRNTCIQNTEITMQLIDGPLKDLHGKWRFISMGSHSSKIIFSVEFDFENPLLNIVSTMRVGSVVEQIINAFVKRAEQVYG